jgi:putative acetyltransferase
MQEMVMGSQFRIGRDDLTGAAITELLTFHLQEMRRWSPACKVHAMPVERLREPDVTFYSAWSRCDQGHDRLAACGALKEIDARRL